MIKKLLVLFIAFFLFATNKSMVSAAPPEDFQTSQVVGSGLSGPSGLDIAPDGRIFILERTGKVHIYKDGALLAQPFAELPSAATGDRGLTGITFDPSFDQNHYVYFYYTGLDLINRLVRFTALGDVGQNMQVLYQTSSPSFELHIGGTIAFGTDGKLYISIGDNGNAQNAQDLSNPHGKILRINKDGTIPSDNPFAGQENVLPEIWAYGFRNPFRFQFDKQTQKLYVGDVGDATWEEVNLVESGKNYGWPICEGMCTQDGMTNPLYTYPHDSQSSAVVVGPVYRKNLFPQQYQGRVFIADYARGFIKTLTTNPDGTLASVENFDLAAGSVVDLKQAEDGSIYYVTYIPGRVYKITYSETSSLPVAVASADNTGGEEPLTVQFSSQGSYDPDDDPISFLWDFGDGTTSTEANPSKVYTQKGTYTVELEVSDGQNTSQATPIVIQVGIPPTINIGSPQDGSSYNSGDVIFYTASAVDGAGFDLSDGDFTTEVVFHHGTHIHPFLGPIVGKTGQFSIPRSGEPDTDQWYEIIIRATDANGLTSQKSVNIYPNVVNFSLHSEPSGLNVLLNGVNVPTPYTFETVVGYEHTVSVPVVQANLQFHHWSDNQKTQHIYQVPDTNSSLTAVFQPRAEFEASYFSNKTLSGQPVLVRTDPNINFNWGTQSPAAQVGEDNFSVRWTTRQYFSEGRYVFSTVTDDGVRLYINDNLVINQWHDQSPTRHNKMVNLAAGEYEVVMEYFESVGGAIAILEYELAFDQSLAPPTFAVFEEYWNYSDVPLIPTTEAQFTHYSDDFLNNWQSGSPDPSINNDNFVARFTKTQSLIEGTYRFRALSDDGVRIKIDGVTILDKWVDQPPTLYEADVFVPEGSHTIEVEYYERTAGAVIEVTYERVSDTPPPQDEFGLNATYFDNKDFSGNSTKMKVADINFDWGATSPEGIGPDTFSARFSSKFEVPLSGEYTFYAISDDGVRVKLADEWIIDQWIDQPPTEATSQSVSLTAGTKYDLLVEYYENFGGAMVKLYYASPTISKRLVPSSAFTPFEISVPSDAFAAEFWQFDSAILNPEIPTTQADITREDTSVFFNWRELGPDPAIAADYFLARWQKTITVAAGMHEFKVTADDGVRVYLDNQLILDQWHDSAPATYTLEQQLTAGEHDLRIEYYEKTGWAVMEFALTKI